MGSSRHQMLGAWGPSWLSLSLSLRDFRKILSSLSASPFPSVIGRLGSLVSQATSHSDLPQVPAHPLAPPGTQVPLCKKEIFLITTVSNRDFLSSACHLPGALHVLSVSVIMKRYLCVLGQVTYCLCLRLCPCRMGGTYPAGLG